MWLCNKKSAIVVILKLSTNCSYLLLAACKLKGNKNLGMQCEIAISKSPYLCYRLAIQELLLSYF